MYLKASISKEKARELFIIEDIIQRKEQMLIINTNQLRTKTYEVRPSEVFLAPNQTLLAANDKITHCNLSPPEVDSSFTHEERKNDSLDSHQLNFKGLPRRNAAKKALSKFKEWDIRKVSPVNSQIYKHGYTPLDSDEDTLEIIPLQVYSHLSNTSLGNLCNETSINSSSCQSCENTLQYQADVSSFLSDQTDQDLHVETVHSHSVPIEQDPSAESLPEDNYLSIPPSSVPTPLADCGVYMDSNLISELLTPMINDLLHFNSIHPRPPLRRSSRLKFKPIDYMSFHRDGKK